MLEIILDRPPVNAISRDVNRALHEAFVQLRDDPELMVGILTGGGERAFSAGWDLKEVAKFDSIERGRFDMGPGGLGGFTELWDLHKPVIAAVNGHVVGGGFEMLLAADIVVAVEGVEFFLPELQRGLIPDGGGIQRIARKIPYNVALDLILTGRHMPVTEAKHWGLVQYIVPRTELMAKARDVATLVSAGAPLAVQAVKEVLAVTMSLSERETFERMKSAWDGGSGMPVYEDMLRSDDYWEGSVAFAEKRSPRWTGVRRG
jgi:crotonobetainyl-CoA hydratase